MIKPILYFLFTTCFVFGAAGQERKPIAQVNTDALTTETQATTSSKKPGKESDSMNLIWAIPIEFWQASFAVDDTTTPAQKKQILSILEKYLIVGVVQADISDLGGFTFLDEAKVKSGMTIMATDAAGKKQAVVPTQNIAPEAEAILAALKPMLQAAMGQMGDNFHFFVVEENPVENQRVFNPFEGGRLDIQLTLTDGEKAIATVETPLDSLFVPRKCPNGKNAHVTWKFCPWTGRALK